MAIREKADGDLVRRQNRQLVLQTLRQHGPMARVELGRRTGLSPASITSISGQLITERLIQELAGSLGAGPVRRGRPLVNLDLNPDAARIVVVKLSIDGIELALADFRGRIVTREIIQIAVYGVDPASFGQAVAQEIRRFTVRHRVKRGSILRIAVAVQGVADTQAGTIVWSPAFRARNIPICGPVIKALGIDCTISNDANMMAEGLISIDPDRYRGTSAVIFMGYGVGMGLIINGAVYHGSTGATAEFGHMNHLPGGPLCRCGRRGCIEAFVADYAIERAAEGNAGSGMPKVSPISEQTMERIEQSALSGDPLARRAFQQAGEALGYGIARLIALLSPEHIVLAGPGTRAMALIEPSLRQAIDDGVVDALRRNVDLDVVPLATDMIVKGTIDESLRLLDRGLLAAGPPYAQTVPMEASA